MPKKILVALTPYTLDASAPTQPAILTDAVPAAVILQGTVAMTCVLADGTLRPATAGDQLSIDENGGHRARSADVTDDDGCKFTVGTDANVLRCTVGGFTFPILFRGND